MTVTPEEGELAGLGTALKVLERYALNGGGGFTRAEAGKILEILRAQRERGAPEGWRPIETAPKTGSDYVAKYFLAYCPDEHPDDRIRVIWWEPKLKGGKWHDDRDLEDKPSNPTHWMPLPPPPTAPQPASPPRESAREPFAFKERRSGFLSQDHIDHDSEVFDYTRELHEVLWRISRAVDPGASGFSLQHVLPDIIAKLEASPPRESEEGKLRRELNALAEKWAKDLLWSFQECAIQLREALSASEPPADDGTHDEACLCRQCCPALHQADNAAKAPAPEAGPKWTPGKYGYKREATLFENDENVLEIGERQDGTFDLISHQRHGGNVDKWDDVTIWGLKPEQLAPLAALADPVANYMREYVEGHPLTHMKAVAPAPEAGLAEEQNRAKGWTLDPSYLTEVQKEVEKATGEYVQWEGIEAVILADRRLRPDPASEGLLREALESAKGALEAVESEITLGGQIGDIVNYAIHDAEKALRTPSQQPVGEGAKP